MAMGFASCSSSENPDDLVEMYPVKISNSAWSFVDKDGNIVYEDEFKNCPTPVIDGHFTVREGDTFTFYEAGKKPKAVAEGFKSVGTFYDGVIPVVMPQERISIMTGSGKVIKTIEPVSGKEITKISSASQEGMFMIVNEDGEVGYANTKGEVVIAPKYVEGSMFSEGYAVVLKEKGDDEKATVIIDKKGKEVGKLKQDWEPRSGFISGRMAVRDNDGRWGFANTKGEVEKRLPEKVNKIADFNEDYMIWRGEDGYGLWKIGADQPEIKAKYDYLYFYDDKYLLAENDDKYFLVDYSGEKKVEFDDYKYVSILNGKGFELIAREGSHYVLINSEGKPVGKEEFKDVSTYVSMSNYVRSDYFNIDGMVKQLVDEVTKTGYGKYSLGDAATKFNLSVEDNKWSSQLSLEKVEGYRYTIEGTVFFDERIVDYTFDYYYDTNYFINPNAKIYGIGVAVDAQTDIWKASHEKIVDALKDKGFKVEASNTDGVTSLVQGNTHILVNGSGSRIYLAITKEAIPVPEATGSDEVATETVDDYDYDYESEEVAVEAAPEAAW